GDRPLASLRGDGSTFRSELRITLQVGHACRREKRGQIQTADKGVGPDEVQIIGIPLLILDNAVSVTVAPDLILHYLLDAWPILFKERIVIGHEMLAIAFQDRTALAVGRIRGMGIFATEADSARLRIESGSEVLLSPRAPLQFRKQAGHAVRVIP